MQDSDRWRWHSNSAAATIVPLIADLFATGGQGFADAVQILKTFKSNGGTIIAVLSGHTHQQSSATTDGINHIVFKNGYMFFELVSVDLENKIVTCKSVNASLDTISLPF